MKRIVSIIGICFTIAFILFVGLKSCIVKVWLSPETPITYTIHGVDGRSLSLIILPKNEGLFLYTKEGSEFFEAALTKMRGEYGNRLVGGIWKVEGPGIGIGFPAFRFFPEGTEPVVMEITVLKKYVYGISEQVLRTEGERTHSVILFSDTAVRFEGMWLDREPTNQELVQQLINILEKQ